MDMTLKTVTFNINNPISVAAALLIKRSAKCYLTAQVCTDPTACISVLQNNEVSGLGILYTLKEKLLLGSTQLPSLCGKLTITLILLLAFGKSSKLVWKEKLNSQNTCAMLNHRNKLQRDIYP